MNNIYVHFLWQFSTFCLYHVSRDFIRNQGEDGDLVEKNRSTFRNTLISPEIIVLGIYLFIVLQGAFSESSRVPEDGAAERARDGFRACGSRRV